MSDTTKPKRDYKSLRLSFGKKTKMGGWSGDLTIEDFEILQALTPEQVVGGRISHREITSTNKKTGEQFTSLVYEILLPERILELKEQSAKYAKRPAEASASDDI